MHTPFFPAFRQRLANLGRRVQKLRQQSLCHLELLLAPALPPGSLAPTDEHANSRQRVFSLRRTFFAFLYQVLNPDCPCREIVRQVQALLALQEHRHLDEGTSAYCQARKRLPLDTLQRLRNAVAAAAETAATLWHGLRPKVVDATTVSLPDTPQNQRAYPQSRSQKPGCGFPLLRLVGIFSLASGALLDYAKGNKHHSELRLFKAMLKQDRLFTWHRPDQKPCWLPRSWWKKVPSKLDVRVIRFRLPNRGYRPQSVTLVTTLLDPQRYPAADTHGASRPQQ